MDPMMNPLPMGEPIALIDPPGESEKQAAAGK